jgi:beta-glucosidase
VADVLFGNVAPSGKLPITFPQSTAQLPPFEEYSMKERTYRYATREPAYPFGFGLGYSRFTYSDLKLENGRLSPGEAVRLRVTLTNSGERDAEEVVQVYLSDLEASTVVPFQKLVAFQRVALAAGASQEVSFTLDVAVLEFINDEGEAVVEAGAFRLTVGGCAPGVRGEKLGAPRPVTAEFVLA